MNVRVSGKQLEIGTALPEKVRAELEATAAKHLDGDAEASIVFSYEGSMFRADGTMHLDSGPVMKAEGTGKDAYLAFSAMLEHLEKQLRRYKRRLKSHH
jgi:ribosomal subunit interface protein